MSMLTTQLGFEIGLNSVIFFATLLILLVTLSGLVAQLVIDITSLFYNFFRSVLDISIGDGGMGSGGDIVFKMINSDAVKKIFFALLAVALILLILSTFIKSITTEFNFAQGGNAKSKIFFSALKALALFVVVPVVSILAIGLANWLLGTILKAIESSANLQDFTTILTNAFGVFDGANYFNFFANLIVIGLVWSIAKKFWGAIIGVVMRMYELTTLFVISTPLIAVMPLTENPYKKWLSSFTSRVLGLFGLVLSVNFCVLLISVANSIGVNELFRGASSASAYSVSGNAMLGAGDASLSWFGGVFVDYAIIIGGLSLIDSISKLISEAVGGMDYLSAGTSAGNAALSAVSSGVKRFGAVAAPIAGKLSQKAKEGLAARKLKKDQKERAQNAEDEAKDELDKANADVETAQNNLFNAKGLQAKKKAAEQLKEAKAKQADAKKKYDAAKADNDYVKSGRGKIGLTPGQSGVLKDLQNLHDQYQNATPEQQTRIKEQMDKKMKELSKAGIDTSDLKAAFGDQGAFNSIADKMERLGAKTKVAPGAMRKRIIAAQVAAEQGVDDAKKQLKDLQGEQQGLSDAQAQALETVQTERQNLTTADQRIITAQNEIERLERVHRKAISTGDTALINDTKFKLIDARKEKQEAVRNRSEVQAHYDEAQNLQTVAQEKYTQNLQEQQIAEQRISRGEKFIARSKAMENVQSTARVISNAAAGIILGSTFGDSQFGKSFTEIKQAIQKSTPDFFAWDSSATTAMKKQYADILEHVKETADIAKEAGKKLEEEKQKIRDTFASQRSGLSSVDFTSVIAQAAESVRTAQQALADATASGDTTKITQAQASLDAALKEQAELPSAIAQQKVAMAKELASINAQEAKALIDAEKSTEEKIKERKKQTNTAISDAGKASK